MLQWAAASPLRTLIMLACAAVAFYFTIGMSQRLVQLYGMHQEQALLRQEITALEAREAGLLAERDRLVKHQDIESIARTELNMIKPGETAVIVYPASVPPEPVEATPEPVPQREPSWLERLLGR